LGLSGETITLTIVVISSEPRSGSRSRRKAWISSSRSCGSAKARKAIHGTLRSLVENEVQKLLHHGKANRQRVAKALGLSAQTLSERLVDENTSFDHVVDRLRHSLALQYVKEPNISLAQIAWLLGYEGPTSFNNALARWTGRSASASRKEQQRPKVEPDPPPH
jgi:AraC-like DNA-binding protein